MGYGYHKKLDILDIDEEDLCDLVAVKLFLK